MKKQGKTSPKKTVIGLNISRSKDNEILNISQSKDNEIQQMADRANFTWESMELQKESK